MNYRLMLCYTFDFRVKKDVLPLVQSLCQDCFYEVRAAMCRELPLVAKGFKNCSFFYNFLII